MQPRKTFMSLPAALRDLRLQPGRAVGEQLAEWCESLAAHADLCRDRKDPKAAVHQLRLVAKTLRAAIRLANPGTLGPNLARLDASVRKRSAALGSMRDSVVQAELLRRLVRREDRPLRLNVARLAREWESPQPGTGLQRRIAIGLSGCARRLARELTTRAEAPGIRKALRRSLRKTLAWREASEEEGATEAFHAWRRWQKRLESQLRLAAAVSSRRLDRHLDRLHGLQEELGALHDVDELAVRLRSRPNSKHLDPEQRQRVDTLLHKRQARLQRRVLRLAKKAVDRELEDHVRSVVRFWAKWKLNTRRPAASTPGSRSRSVRVPPRT